MHENVTLPFTLSAPTMSWLTQKMAGQHGFTKLFVHLGKLNDFTSFISMGNRKGMVWYGLNGKWMIDKSKMSKL